VRFHTPVVNDHAAAAALLREQLAGELAKVPKQRNKRAKAALQQAKQAVFIEPLGQQRKDKREHEHEQAATVCHARCNQPRLVRTGTGVIEQYAHHLRPDADLRWSSREHAPGMARPGTRMRCT
jgi:hypothetical protein